MKKRPALAIEGPVAGKYPENDADFLNLPGSQSKETVPTWILKACKTAAS